MSGLTTGVKKNVFDCACMSQCSREQFSNACHLSVSTCFVASLLTPAARPLTLLQLGHFFGSLDFFESLRTIHIIHFAVSRPFDCYTWLHYCHISLGPWQVTSKRLLIFCQDALFLPYQLTAASLRPTSMTCGTCVISCLFPKSSSSQL